MDYKEKIKKVVGSFVKNHNFVYKKAKDSRIKNRKQHDLNKKTKQLKKFKKAAQKKKISVTVKQKKKEMLI